MKFYLMLILAVIMIVPFLLVGITKHLYIEYQKDDTLSFRKYSFDTSYYLDIAACVAIYNVLGHTLSAVAYEKNDKIMMTLANALFWDRNHCYDSWVKEYQDIKDYEWQ